jgi:eukaryotic-like serine/threonine-protein kinase
MGEVYLGLDPAIDREVAIKTILPSSSQKEEAKRRFAREARAAGVLNHPNIVTIYEFGEDQDLLYIAMERVKGQDLEELIRLQTLTHGEILEVLAQVCDGLEFAHRHGVIHRDIKPSNIRVLRDGRRLLVKVMDFGVARLDNAEMTATGTVVGTVSYMAPEYISAGKPDARSDLFAIGVTLYECISGRKPFGGDTAPTILYKIVHEAPDPIDLSHLDGISPAVRVLLDRALAKNPAQRFETAEELGRALRAAKDPTWRGPVPEEATQQIGSRAESAQKTRERDPLAQTVVLNPPRHARSSARPILLGAAGISLLAICAYTVHRLRPPALPANPASLSQTDAVRAPKASLQAETPAPASSKGNAPPAGSEGGGHEDKSPEPKPKAPPPRKTTPVPPPEVLRNMTASQRQSISNMSLSEAINLADTDPKRALDGFRASMSVNPANANAYAWTIAILYEQGRFGEIPAIFAKARENGIDRSQMISNLRFRMAMQNDRLNHRIPSPGGE